MENNETVKTLLEMGIPREVAVDALMRTGGNLEDAVAFIFSNELPQTEQEQPYIPININDQDPLPSEQDLANQDYRSSNTPSSVPGSNNPFRESNNYLGDEYVEGQEVQRELIDVDSSDDEDEDEDDGMDGYRSESRSISQQNGNVPESFHIESATNSMSQEMIPPKYNLVAKGPLKDELDQPTIILPLPLNSMIENYLSLFALNAVINIPQFFLKTDFKDLNYNKNWYKGTSFEMPKFILEFDSSNDTTTINENAERGDQYRKAVDIIPIGTSDKVEKQQPFLLWQLQKLAAINSFSMSERAYASARIFSLVFNGQVRSVLSKSDNLIDVLPLFIKSITTDLQLCPSNSDDESPQDLFITSAFHLPEKSQSLVETKLACLFPFYARRI